MSTLEVCVALSKHVAFAMITSKKLELDRLGGAQRTARFHVCYIVTHLQRQCRIVSSSRVTKLFCSVV